MFLCCCSWANWFYFQYLIHGLWGLFLGSGGFLGIWGLFLRSGGYSWDLGDIFSAKLMFPGEVMCEGVAAICSLGRCSLLLILGLLSSLVCSCTELGRHPQTITSGGCLPFFSALIFQEAQQTSSQIQLSNFPHAAINNFLNRFSSTNHPASYEMTQFDG